MPRPELEWKMALPSELAEISNFRAWEWVFERHLTHRPTSLSVVPKFCADSVKAYIIVISADAVIADKNTGLYAVRDIRRNILDMTGLLGK